MFLCFFIKNRYIKNFTKLATIVFLSFPAFFASNHENSNLGANKNSNSESKKKVLDLGKLCEIIKTVNPAKLVFDYFYKLSHDFLHPNQDVKTAKNKKFISIIDGCKGTLKTSACTEEIEIKHEGESLTIIRNVKPCNSKNCPAKK